MTRGMMMRDRTPGDSPAKIVRFRHGSVCNG